MSALISAISHTKSGKPLTSNPPSCNPYVLDHIRCETVQAQRPSTRNSAMGAKRKPCSPLMAEAAVTYAERAHSERMMHDPVSRHGLVGVQDAIYVLQQIHP